MSWNDFNAAPEPDNTNALKAKRSFRQALRDNPDFEDYLTSVLSAPTYHAGATLAEVSYAEGQRSLARLILTNGKGE